jgi:thioredoxin reductase
MNVLDIDTLVIGFSVAGVAGAERLAKSRHRVGYADYAFDSGSIDETFVLGRTPWNDSQISGEEFKQIALDKLRDSRAHSVEGVLLSDMAPGAAVSGFTGLADNGRVRFATLLFAPNGTEPGLEEGLGAERFFGRGISYSAAVDVPFFKGRRVAVLGAGPRAADDVVRAAKVAERVFWLRAANSAGRGVSELETDSRVEVIEPATIRRLDGDESGGLRGMLVETDGGQRELEVASLFLAQDLQPSWKGLGGEGAARELMRKGLMVAAGTAAGVRYWDHASLFASGVAAAESLLDREE